MKLNIISCVTDSPRFLWEVDVLLTNLKEFGHSSITTLLIFQHRAFYEKEFSPEWKKLEEKFPETKFVYYKDHTNVSRSCQIFGYLPLFRLYVLQEYFKKHPELEKEAIFYIDSDIILTKPIDFSVYLEDEVNYLSWTGNPERTDNYLWQPYFDSKKNKVVPDKLAQYSRIDVLNKTAEICGTTREQIALNSTNIGGAQYILKNINAQFWTDCFNYTCEIKLFLSNINQIFMQGKTFQEKEDNGFQSFCSDMFSVMFSLIAKGAKIECPKELDFAWSCDRIDRLKTTKILHNAGITSDAKVRVAFEKLPDGTNKFEEAPMFYKGAFLEKSPLDDIASLEALYNNPLNKQFCNNKYVEAILKTKQI